MSFAAALLTAKESVAVAKGVSDLVKAGGFEKRKLRKILTALEKLYFTPNGILPILDSIASGENVDTNAVSAALFEFNDGEWGVQDAARELNFDALAAADFPLRLRTSLQAAAYGKLSLRRDLQNALNVPSGNLLIERDMAKELVARIRALNTELEAIDEHLR